MNIFKRFQELLVLPVILTFMFGTLPIAAVNAQIVDTDQVLNQINMNADRERVAEFVDREDVQKEMLALGVNPEEAKQRVNTLSDSEIQQIAGKLDEMPAGEGAVGAVIGAALTVFIVLLITDILCLTSVFDFTKCAR